MVIQKNRKFFPIGQTIYPQRLSMQQGSAKCSDSMQETRMDMGDTCGEDSLNASLDAIQHNKVGRKGIFRLL